MSILKDIFKVFNGSSWDEHYFKTSSDQVVHTKSDGTATTVQEELLAQNSAMNEYIRIIEVESARSTIPAKQGANVICPKTSLEGYRFIGIIGAIPNGDASIICQINEWVYNHNDTPRTISVTYKLLFRKS